MKIKKLVPVFGLLLCAAVDAADIGPSIKIENRTGHAILLRLDVTQMGTSELKSWAAEMVAGQELDVDKEIKRYDSEWAKRFSPLNLGHIKTLGVRYKYTMLGGLSAVPFDSIDIADLSSHPGQNLIITIEASYGGYGAFVIHKEWRASAAGGNIYGAPGSQPGSLRLQPITTNNPYEILGVSPFTPKNDVKKAYLELMKKNHPDKNPGQKDLASENTKKITEAYNKLFQNKPEQE